MGDYSYPGIFFSYLLFAIFLAGGLYFFTRSIRDGYWGDRSEDAKFRMLHDDEVTDGRR